MAGVPEREEEIEDRIAGEEITLGTLNERQRRRPTKLVVFKEPTFKSCEEESCKSNSNTCPEEASLKEEREQNSISLLQKGGHAAAS